MADSPGCGWDGSVDHAWLEETERVKTLVPYGTPVR